MSLPILAPLAEEEERRAGNRQITYLVVFPFLPTLALHLWGGLPVDLVRTKGTDCNIDLNTQYPESPTVGLQRTGETGVGWKAGKVSG